MKLITRTIEKIYAEDTIITNETNWGMGQIKQGNNTIYIPKKGYERSNRNI